jgi:hypothetical protein
VSNASDWMTTSDIAILSMASIRPGSSHRRANVLRALAAAMSSLVSASTSAASASAWIATMTALPYSCNRNAFGSRAQRLPSHAIQPPSSGTYAISFP